MSLLAPALLAGLALLAVPVLVHLTRRHRADVAPFPSLMFLRRIPIRTTKRRRIRHPLLFALRCIAVVLIVLAFTRPYVAGGAEGTSENMRDVVLLVDVSGSMGYEERRAAAATAAREVLAELGEGDRAALVTFDDRASARASLTAGLAAVDAALGALPASDRPTRIENGLQLAGRILGESDRSTREVVLISDFQRTGWDGTGRTRLPDGVALRMVPVDEGDTPNLAVVDVRFAAGHASARHRLLARVLNLGDTAVTGIEVELELAGRPVAAQAVDVAPREAATVLFDDVPLPAGRPLGRIRIAGDGLAADDELRFVATPDPVLDVTLVEGPGGRADRSLYLERALALGEQPRTRLTRRSTVGAVGDTAGGALVLNDAVPDAADAERLSEWVAAGGALFVVLGPSATAERWQGRDARLLGGRVGSVVDRAGRGGSRLTAIDYDHPVFEAFSAPRSGDFSTTRFWRFREFEADSLTTVLARFEDGEPALTEHSMGAGRVLTWASTLDRFWNDLALQPVFLPFVLRVLRHTARWQPPERWVVAGASREAGALAADGDAVAEWVLVTPGGSRVPIEADGDEPWIEFDEAGFYRLEPVGGGDPVAEVAVNLPPAESDLAPIAPERIAGEVVGDLVVRNDPAGVEGVAGGAGGADGVGEPRTAGGVGTGPDGAPGRRELWWPLLALAGVALGAESWLANRSSWSSTRRRDS